jgi:hypothetical protein
MTVVTDDLKLQAVAARPHPAVPREIAPQRLRPADIQPVLKPNQKATDTHPDRPRKAVQLPRCRRRHGDGCHARRISTRMTRLSRRELSGIGSRRQSFGRGPAGVASADAFCERLPRLRVLLPSLIANHFSSKVSGWPDARRLPPRGCHSGRNSYPDFSMVVKREKLRNGSNEKNP